MVDLSHLIPRSPETQIIDTKILVIDVTKGESSSSSLLLYENDRI
jgi:hypothetical protein